MRKIMQSAVVITMVLFPIIAIAGELRKGDIVFISGAHILKVANENPVLQNEYSFNFGEKCFTDNGAKAKIIGISKDKILIEYGAPRAIKGHTRCLSGVLSLIPAKKLQSMTNEYNRNKLKDDNEKGLVRELLKQQ